jgi:hypothetical protein
MADTRAQAITVISHQEMRDYNQSSLVDNAPVGVEMVPVVQVNYPEVQTN